MVELWISLANQGFSKYEVSSLGHVLNTISNNILEGHERKDGYIEVHITNDEGYSQKKLVHKLVVDAFIGVNNDSSLTVDHIDRNRSNNVISNLRLATSTQQGLNRQSYTRQTRKIC